MPTYDFECQKCGNSFEFFQSMTADPSVPCPKCAGETKRLIGSGAGIIFKGSGFYETDYKRKESKDSAKSDTKKPVCPMKDECKGCDSVKE